MSIPPTWGSRSVSRMQAEVRETFDQLLMVCWWREEGKSWIPSPGSARGTSAARKQARLRREMRWYLTRVIFSGGKNPPKTHFAFVFITGRLEKTAQERGGERLPLPSLRAGVGAARTRSVLLQGNDPCPYWIRRNVPVSHIFKSISGLSEGAGLKLLQLRCFPW